MSERLEKQIRDLEKSGWIAQDIAEVLSLPVGEVEAEMIGPCEHGFLPHQECRFCIADAEEMDHEGRNR